MPDKYEFHAIAKMESDFTDKFGIPRQSGLVPELRSTIVFEPEYRDINAVRGLESYSHIWIIWLFSKSVRENWSPTVRPPRLGGNQRMGVFATRSPFRPNPVGLSCVKLESIEYSDKRGPLLHVSGADLLDGTPILDIKPYVPYADMISDAAAGFTSMNSDYRLSVEDPNNLHCKLPEDRRDALLGVLSQDPRPAFQHDPERVYSMSFAGYEVAFSVSEQNLTILRIRSDNKKQEE